MNILFVLYGGIETNSFLCLSRFAKELDRRGDECAVVLLCGERRPCEGKWLHAVSTEEALKKPESCFKNGKKADVIHAWTPRQNVANFVAKYREKHPAPLFIFSEDDEEWLAEEWMQLPAQGIYEKIKNSFCSKKIPPYLSHPLQASTFLKSADAVAVIAPALQKKLPQKLPSEVLIPGVDLKEFFSREALPSLRKKYHLDPTEKLIVYCGGVNPFTGPAIRDLCQMVALLNERGHSAKLVRSGMRKLTNIAGIKKEELKYVLDLGLIPREEIPGLMSLATIFVQPGRPSPFEEGRLPCKIIEFMAMGIPSLLPHCNVGLLVQEGREAMVHRTGRPEEMASLCEKVLTDASLEQCLRVGARTFAEKYFDIQKNSDQLKQLYQQAVSEFKKKNSVLF